MAVGELHAQCLAFPVSLCDLVQAIRHSPETSGENVYETCRARQQKDRRQRGLYDRGKSLTIGGASISAFQMNCEAIVSG
jgi:hypothetical protein